MRRLTTSLLCAGALVITVIGCEDDDSPTATTESSMTTTEAPDDSATTLAEGNDVEIVEGVPQSGTLSRTLNIDAVEEDGEVTGEFRLNNVVVTLQCADTHTIDGEIRVGGELSDDPDGRLVALIIREKGPDGDDRVLLYSNERAGSCAELVESVPYNLDGGYFDQVQDGYDIETGGVIFNP